MKFAKIVTVDGEDVLFYLQPSNEEDKEDLHQITRIDGMYVDAYVKGIKAEIADEAFEKLDENAARLVLRLAEKVAP